MSMGRDGTGEIVDLAERHGTKLFFPEYKKKQLFLKYFCVLLHNVMDSIISYILINFLNKIFISQNYI